MIDHRLQHLCRSNDRQSSFVAFSNNPFLNERHLFRGHLHSKVPTCDHHTVCFIQNLIEPFNSFWLLQFGDEGNVKRRTLATCAEFRLISMHKLTTLTYILWSAYKTQRNIINPMSDPELQVRTVFLRQSRSSDSHARK